MGSRLKNILFAVVVFLLVAAIEAPSFFKLWHAVYVHKEMKCDQESIVHIHQAEFDCDFQKYHTTLHFFLPQHHNDEPSAITHKVDELGYYFFISSFQQLHFSLRGPPTNT